MSDPLKAVVLGAASKTRDEIQRHLEYEGFVSEISDASDPNALAGRDVVIFIADLPTGPPSPAALAAYLSSQIEKAARIPSHFDNESSNERAIVLIAPSLGASLTNGPTAASTAAGLLRGLSRAWAVELGERGIRCNLIQPGIVEGDAPLTTDMPTIALHRPDHPLCTPEDIAKAAVFLASPVSSYIDGVELDVDGGLKESRQSLASALWNAQVTGPGSSFAKILQKQTA